MLGLLAVTFIVVIGVGLVYLTPRLENSQSGQSIGDVCYGSGTGTSQQSSNNESSRPVPPPPFFDTQLYIGFNANFSSLAYNVTALKQNDSYGYGPAYLLNGYTNEHYWYQVGLTWHWSHALGGYIPGFSFFYEVWSQNRTSVFPRNGGAAIQPFSGPVMPDDVVLLSLNLSKGDVVMLAFDWNTSSSASIRYDASGASYFEGARGHQYFWTGLMTEWYHGDKGFCSPRRVTFSNYKDSVSRGWMCVSEWNFTNIPLRNRFNSSEAKQLIYHSCSGSLSFVTAHFQAYRTNGTVIYANPHLFVTE